MLVPILLRNNRDCRLDQPVKRKNMADKTSTGRTMYQGSASNSRRGFRRGRDNLYGRGRGCKLNQTRLKIRGKYEDLGNKVYLIGDAQQAYKYTKTT